MEAWQSSHYIIRAEIVMPMWPGNLYVRQLTHEHSNPDDPVGDLLWRQGDVDCWETTVSIFKLQLGGRLDDIVNRDICAGIFR